jgi:DNA-binding NtrC family response regulator
MSTEKIVLHVDDDPAILNIVRASLQKRGYPRNALGVLAACGARVVLLDIDMPGKDGLSLLSEIKNRDGGIQVVMLTGMVSMGTILQATGLGAQHCVFKPVHDMNRVGDAVDRCFANIENWWTALREWIERKNNSEMAMVLDQRQVAEFAPSRRSDAALSSEKLACAER